MDSLAGAGILFAIVAVSGGAWFTMQLLPKMKTGFGFKKRTISKENQPLYEIFYQFDHDSAQEWIQWILTQDKETKDYAFEQLIEYLKEPSEELGAATKEVVKAVIAFKYPEGYATLLGLIQNARIKWGQLKSLSLFYETAALGLVQLNNNNGYKVLKTELEESKNKQNNVDELQIAIVRALASAETDDTEKFEYWSRVLYDRELSSAVKREVINQLTEYDDEIKGNIYKKVIKDYTNSKIGSLEKNDEETIEAIFYQLKKFITAEDEDAWFLCVDACNKEVFQELFVKLISEFVSFPAEELTQLQFLELLDTDPKIKAVFREALGKRFKLSEQESNICVNKIKLSDFDFDKLTINIEKSKKTKAIANDVLGDYQSLEKIIKNSQGGGKIEKKSAASIPVVTGDGETEKLYIFRGLAANLNRSFVYIDLEKMLSSPKEVAQLQEKLGNTKPCIVYLDCLEGVLRKTLGKVERDSLKIFHKIVRELGSLPSVSFVGNITISEDELREDKEFHRMLTDGPRGSYMIALNIVKPDFKERRRLIHQFASKVTEKRTPEWFSLDEILNHTEGKSTLEFIHYTVRFFEVSLLTSGELMRIKDFEDLLAGIKVSKADENEEEEAALEEEALKAKSEKPKAQDTDEPNKEIPEKQAAAEQATDKDKSLTGLEGLIDEEALKGSVA